VIVAGTLSITFSRSTLARPATCVLRVEHLLHNVLGRAGSRRPFTSVTERIPTNRSSAHHSPRVLPHDPIMQCNPESGRRTRLTCYSGFFIYLIAERLGGCQPIALSPFA